jgi:hypothetical protein
MTEYKEKLNSFASRLKNEIPQSPIQEIRPITKNSIVKEAETQLNIWISKSIMKSLKRHTLEHDKTIKDSVIEAITNYLES